MTKIGYAEFLQLTGFRANELWAFGLEIRANGGIFVKPPDCLFADEEACLSRHPLKDLTKPILPFPCTLEELEIFIKEYALDGCIDPAELVKIEREVSLSPEAMESRGGTGAPHEPQVNSDRSLIGRKEIAAYLDCSESSVKAYMKTRTFPYYKTVTGRLAAEPSELEAWLAKKSKKKK